MDRKNYFFPRQFMICLTFSLLAILFALSCQKDDGLKQKDPNALTKAQAKEYFEQTAKTLKFLTAVTTPTGTKSADYSLTENMVIEWDQALECEKADSYIVEVPIRMASPVTALLYDGVGHINKNIRQVQVNTSLLIEKHKGDGCLHHSVVTTVGTYSKAPDNIKYAYLNDKSSFSGYQIFSTEDGLTLSSFLYLNGAARSVDLKQTTQISKVDSLGTDFSYRGIRFMSCSRPHTKGGAGPGSGEDYNCPFCGNVLSVQPGNVYLCNDCVVFFYDMFDVTCPDCGGLAQYCVCVCLECGFPNKFFNECACVFGNGDLCPECGQPGCNKRCLQGIDGDIPYCVTCKCFATDCHCGQYTYCKTCGQINNCLCNGSGGNN